MPNQNIRHSVECANNACCETPRSLSRTDCALVICQSRPEPRCCPKGRWVRLHTSVALKLVPGYKGRQFASQVSADVFTAAALAMVLTWSCRRLQRLMREVSSSGMAFLGCLLLKSCDGPTFRGVTWVRPAVPSGIWSERIKVKGLRADAMIRFALVRGALI